jgi:leucyl aminopeptidase
MKITPTAGSGAAKIRFIEGSLGLFDGKTLSVAYGDTKPLTCRKFVLAMRKVVHFAKQNRVKKIAVAWKDIRALAPKEMTDLEAARIVASAFVMANYEHNTYKTKPKEGWGTLDSAAVTDMTKDAKAGLALGQTIGAVVNDCRELANTPGGDMTPAVLADAARKAVEGTNATVKVLRRADMEALGMGAVLAIAKGSNEEPRFIVLEYWGKKVTDNKSRKPVVLVGKGVTFDTGGLNVKTGDGMYEMHMDMSGGAAVISAAALAARLKLPVNVVALVPAVENSPSGTSVRPGDVVKSLSGKTIEILNTDAEGRVILADGITYAREYDPEIVVDVATLTGAALVALGTKASAFMVNDEATIPQIMSLAEQSGDYMWPMPAWEEYEDMTKGTFGDVPNLSTMGNSRYGGVIAGGMFLKRFADDLKCPWLHIDMAPRMTSVPGDYLAKGAAGEPVRFLLALIEHYASKDERRVVE